MAHAGRRGWDAGPAGPQPWMPTPAMPGGAGFGGPTMHMGYPQAAGTWQAQQQGPLLGAPGAVRPVVPHTQFPAQQQHIPSHITPHLAAQPAQSHLAQPPSALLPPPHLPHIPAPATQTPTVSLLPTPGAAATSSSVTPASSSTPLPNAQPTQSDLEQKRKERDKRERERKEREQRKQKEVEAQKREQQKKKQQLIAASTTVKEPQQLNLLRNKTDFLCKMQFRNKLPDIPFDPKLLMLPLDPARHTKCIIGSSLENSYKHTLFTEPDLGIPINLIDANMYKIPPGMSGKQVLAPEDQALVDSSSALPRKGTPARPRPAVTWLRRTNYLCNEEDLPQFKAKGVEAQPGVYKLQRAGPMAHDLNTLEGQIRSVEDTFDAVKRTPTHPTNPNARPVEILPIFPDFTLWPNTYTEVVFDADPITMLPSARLDTMDAEEKDYLRNHAIVRGIPNAGQLVAYITPTHKRSREEVAAEEEYEQVHAFHFDVAKDADLKDNFFFVFTPDAVYYNELGTRVKLRKVQSKEEKEQLLSVPRPSNVFVVSEDMTEDTQAARAERLSEMLQPASLAESADA